MRMPPGASSISENTTAAPPRAAMAGTASAMPTLVAEVLARSPSGGERATIRPDRHGRRLGLPLSQPRPCDLRSVSRPLSSTSPSEGRRHREQCRRSQDRGEGWNEELAAPPAAIRSRRLDPPEQAGRLPASLRRHGSSGAFAWRHRGPRTGGAGGSCRASGNE